MHEILKHPFLKEFYSKQEVIEAPSKIRIEVNDNTKLGLKEYRSLIYKIVQLD